MSDSQSELKSSGDMALIRAWEDQVPNPRCVVERDRLLKNPLDPGWSRATER